MGGASRFVTLLTTSPFRPSLLLRLPHRLLSTLPTTRHLTSSPIKSFSSPIQNPPTPTNNNLNTYSIPSSHPWPEWSRLINSLYSYVASEYELLPQDAFILYEQKDLSTHFVSSASLLLAFARNNPELLGMLRRRDIEIIVTNGTPFLFKGALETARRMRAFLGGTGGNALGSDIASTVDLMKYILSYASNPAIPSSRNSIYSKGLVESSVRNLLQELAVLNSGPTLYQDVYGRAPMSHDQNIEMKKGDWICSKYVGLFSISENLKPSLSRFGAAV